MEIIANALYFECVKVEERLCIVSKMLSELLKRLKKLVR